MLVTARALAFVADIEAFKKRRELAGEADKFSTRARQLRTPTERLSALQELALEMTAHGIAVELPSKAIVAAAKQARELLIKFESDPKALVEPDNQLAHQFIPGLSKIESEYQRAIEEGWRQHSEALLPSLPSAVLQAIEMLPAYSTQVAQLRSKHAEVEKLAKVVPEIGTVDSVLRRMTKLIKENEASWHDLSGSGIPEDVLNFLRDSGVKGASLSSLTKPILEWLAGRNLLSSFVVRVR